MLLIEVADTTLQKDRQVKLPPYAVHKIPEVWLVNLLDRHIEVYTEPYEMDYQHKVTYGLTATFAPRSFSEIARQWLPESIHQLLDKFNSV